MDTHEPQTMFLDFPEEWQLFKQQEVDKKKNY